MFLTKKNAGLASKPKDKPKNQRALGGWGDEEEEQTSQNFTHPKTASNSLFQKNLLDDIGSSETPIQVPDYQTGSIRQAPLPMPVKKIEQGSQQPNSYYTLEEL